MTLRRHRPRLNGRRAFGITIEVHQVAGGGRAVVRLLGRERLLRAVRRHRAGLRLPEPGTAHFYGRAVPRRGRRLTGPCDGLLTADQASG